MTPSEGYAVVPEALTGHARQLNALADEMQALTDAAHTSLAGDALGEVGQSFTSLVKQFVTAGTRALQSGIDAMQATGTGVQSSVNTLEHREGDTAAGFGGTTVASASGPVTRGLNGPGPSYAIQDGAHLQQANLTAPQPRPVPGLPGQPRPPWSESPARTWDLRPGDNGRSPGLPTPVTAEKRAQLADQLADRFSRDQQPWHRNPDEWRISPDVADLAVGSAPAGTNKVIIGEPGAGAAVQFYDERSILWRDRDESGQIRSDAHEDMPVRELVGQRHVEVLDVNSRTGLRDALDEAAGRFGGRPGELWIQVPPNNSAQRVFDHFMASPQTDALNAATRRAFSNIDVTFMDPRGVVLGTIMGDGNPADGRPRR